MGTVNGWLKGGAAPGSDVLVRLTEQHGINGHWLLTGEGTMKTPAAPDVAQRALDEIAEIVDRVRGGNPVEVAVSDPGEDPA